MKRKFDTFIGFSVKAGKIVYGTDNLTQFRRKLRLIIVDNDVSPRTLKTLREVAEAKACPIYSMVSDKLEDIVFKTNCKVIGLTDMNLAQAIIDNSEGIANSIGGIINE